VKPREAFGVRRIPALSTLAIVIQGKAPGIGALQTLREFGWSPFVSNARFGSGFAALCLWVKMCLAYWLNGFSFVYSSGRIYFCHAHEN
jgi:hypothetical protein